MTTQNNINKDMVALLSSVTDGIHQLQKAVKLIHTEINDLKEYKKPNSKFEYTMLKGTESVTQTNYELYDEKPDNSSKERISNK